MAPSDNDQTYISRRHYQMAPGIEWRREPISTGFQEYYF